MNIVKKIFFTVLSVIFLSIVGLYATGNSYLLRGICSTYMIGESSATITDKKHFSTRIVKSGEYIPWEISDSYKEKSLSPRLRNTLEEYESIAFLVLQNGKVDYEEYWGIGSEDSRTNSFSMAKTVVTMLAGAAMADNKINNVFQPVTDFLPEWNGTNPDNPNLSSSSLQIRHLLTMSAGLEWDERYKSPFSITTEAYYGGEIQELILGLNLVEEPGTVNNYQSCATQLLAMVIEKATGKTLSEYASEKLWIPLGAKHDAEWHLDKENGDEIAFCCFNSNARDFARFGQLYLNKGKWHGKQIIPEPFVDISTESSPTADWYGYGWWLVNMKGHDVYYMQGLNGQYTGVIPDMDIVFVRLGHKYGKKIDHQREDFLLYLEEVIDMYQ